MRFTGILLVTLLFSTMAFAGFEGFSSTKSLGVFNKMKCGTGLSCTKTGDKLVVANTETGVLRTQVAATATTITSAQCGSTFINTGAVVINLPEASAVLGCRLTFITGNASNFDVNPDNADQILVITNAAGDAMRNATLGNSIMLEAISASQWAPVGKEQGTWTDIN